MNDRLISAVLRRYTYEWGGAHGSTSHCGFSWWLDQHRAVTPSDIFVSGMNWEQALVSLAIDRLKSKLGQDVLWKGDELTKGVAADVKDSQNWNVTRGGLLITFGQYDVAPYAVGLPTITVPWNALASMLVPNLPIEDLPPQKAPPS